MSCSTVREKFNLKKCRNEFRVTGSIPVAPEGQTIDRLRFIAIPRVVVSRVGGERKNTTYSACIRGANRDRTLPLKCVDRRGNFQSDRQANRVTRIDSSAVQYFQRYAYAYNSTGSFRSIESSVVSAAFPSSNRTLATTRLTVQSDQILLADKPVKGIVHERSSSPGNRDTWLPRAISIKVQ